MLLARGSWVYAGGITGAECKRLLRDCASSARRQMPWRAVTAGYVRSLVRSPQTTHITRHLASLRSRPAQLQQQCAFDIACLPEAAVSTERQSAERGSFSEAYSDRTTEDNPSRYSLLRPSPYCYCCCWCCCCCGDWRKMLLILLPYRLSAAKWCRSLPSPLTPDTLSGFLRARLLGKETLQW